MAKRPLHYKKANVVGPSTYTLGDALAVNSMANYIETYVRWAIPAMNGL